jgi:hypothetical protein
VTRFSSAPRKPSTPEEFLASADSRREEQAEDPSPDRTEEAPKLSSKEKKQTANSSPSRSRKKQETAPVSYRYDTSIIPPPLESVGPPAEAPWQQHDPTERPTKLFNIRLNEYELAMLRYIADLDPDISMQKVVRRILVAELKKRLKVQ